MPAECAACMSQKHPRLLAGRRQLDNQPFSSRTACHERGSGMKIWYLIPCSSSPESRRARKRPRILAASAFLLHRLPGAVWRQQCVSVRAHALKTLVCINPHAQPQVRQLVAPVCLDGWQTGGLHTRTGVDGFNNAPPEAGTAADCKLSSDQITGDAPTPSAALH